MKKVMILSMIFMGVCLASESGNVRINSEVLPEWHAILVAMMADAARGSAPPPTVEKKRVSYQRNNNMKIVPKHQKLSHRTQATKAKK